MSNDVNKDGILYELSPKFSFIYELFMPTGRKIKNTITILFIVLIATIFFLSGTISADVGSFVIFGDVSIIDILQYICVISTILLVLKLIFHIVIQIMQYKHITYTFYNTHMVYEDDFLNQHRKNIEYSNIKEVEIRRTIIDRILGFGVIVIYTNAENRRSNGLVIYGIKEPKTSYNIIYNIIHNDNNQLDVDKKEDVNKEERIDIKEKEVKENIQSKEEKSVDEEYSSEEQRIKRLEESKKEEAEFLESLKDINDDNS